MAARLPMALPLDLVLGPGKTVWVVGSDPLSGVVAHSRDGGATWTWTCVAGHPRAVSFLDDRRGFVIARDVPALLVTADGGRTFVERPIGLSIQKVSDLHFVDAQRGWLAGTGNGAGPSGIVATTIDGGATWQASTFPGVDVSDVWVAADGTQALAVGARGDRPPVVLTMAADRTWALTNPRPCGWRDRST